MFWHDDALKALDSSPRLEDKLAAIHEALYLRLGTVDRISVAAYDAATGMLRTFLASSPGRSELVRYEAPLADSPTLDEIRKSGRIRVVNDLSIFAGERVHTRILAQEQYRASVTAPIFSEEAFWGLLFFNARAPGVFDEKTLEALDVYARLIGAIVIAEMHTIRMLAAVIRSSHEIMHYRDPETGAHLERVARYSGLIAQHLAAMGAASLDDAQIERIRQFAPLHDLGKIALPDRILLKPAGLTPAERVQMQQHTVRGREMIDAIARNFGIQQTEGLDLLRHIAEYHHEAMDGSGYPRGLRGNEIPLEARIVAVADVFDALTSRRSYKPAWPNAQAIAWLRKLARRRFDEDCVEAMALNAAKIAEIQARFRDEPLEDAA